jgi:hypothetical protein
MARMHPGRLAFRIQYKKAIFCTIFCKKSLLNQFFLSKLCKKLQGVFFQNKNHQTCQNSSFNLVFFTAYLKAELSL